MTDDRTLDEVKKDNADNFSDIKDKLKNQCFPSSVYAYQYRMHCIEKAFQDLGFSPQELLTNASSADTAVDLIDQAMVSRNIRCEDWSEHPEADRQGLYLYKDNEIAYFVALVLQKGSNFIVRSNVIFE